MSPLGGLFAPALNVLGPDEWISSLTGQVALGVLVMAVLAAVLALCSEADAFVAPPALGADMERQRRDRPYSRAARGGFATRCAGRCS